jgi:hypothetical protein
MAEAGDFALFSPYLDNIESEPDLRIVESTQIGEGRFREMPLFLSIHRFRRTERAGSLTRFDLHKYEGVGVPTYQIQFCPSFPMIPEQNTKSAAPQVIGRGLFTELPLPKMRLRMGNDGLIRDRPSPKTSPE